MDKVYRSDDLQAFANANKLTHLTHHELNKIVREKNKKAVKNDNVKIYTQ